METDILFTLSSVADVTLNKDKCSAFDKRIIHHHYEKVDAAEYNDGLHKRFDGKFNLASA
ncbi:hypothetical protein PO124_02915 [Bacillus licheniformis]|nr:hypothetical protein [Bacillus licheniformis]